MSARSWITAALRSDAVSGSLLIGAALTALIWANSPLSPSYEALRSFTVGPAALHLDLSVEAWAADGLLAVFFFIVGTELKQELVHGELRDPRRAALPIAAALGGVAVPALVFLAVNATAGGAAIGGWGIPMATDIAFALAVLAVVGRHLPAPLRTFLLTLATVDDMCAVLVIAVAYTTGLNMAALAAAAAGLVVFGYLQNGAGRAVTRLRSGVPGRLLFGPLAVVIWALTHASGVHATIAGVAMGLLMRTRARDGETVSPSHRAEEVLRPFSAGIALPVFALTSAGVSLSGAGGFWTSSITWGVLAGLLAGKFAGIFGATWLTARFTGAHLNPRLAWPDIAGTGILGGIGFTVSLLIAELSYSSDVHLTDAKGAVLLASAAAALIAAMVLGRRSRHHRRLVDRTGDREAPAGTRG
ncbi:Na+/H+ antiporter NhaA [Streptomyces capillispiralis]|uniref:Na(+)/H(+) antiporter NhaA n=1 Tax=Streptomyces capillispiralis TaxID=68182 RepID=A0A561TRY8_9ACTN|nr:Na+/H+ antiporter NhaA [Streptomyces capillispiralis]TWF89881.1 sodium/proton antiporter (NhaA family) [Streptomyces capillispiralis]GHH95703.1 Na+/H+ antiporter [Streptomyces capillispiralis]